MFNRAGPVRVDSAEEHIRVQLDRPPVNAFTVEMFEQLTVAFSQIRGDPRPVLLCGAAGNFSAGMDIKVPVTDPRAADEAARACVAAVRRHQGPIVAAVEGAAVGVGLLLAMSADFLVIARNARLRMPEIMLGMDADPEPLRGFVPEPWVRRICLLGASVTAEDIGLGATGAIICDAGECHQRAREIIDVLSRLDAGGVRRMKELLHS